jgi:predicted O-methyltransferase YrrM
MVSKIEKVKELAVKALDSVKVDFGFTLVEYLSKMIDEIPSYYAFIYYLCREFKPELMVEIGTYCGMGAVHMALGNPEGKVYTIDKDKRPVVGFDNIECIEGYSYEVHDKFVDNSIDFLFIDGDHRYEYEKLDYERYYPKVKDGGLILIDDISYPDVCKIWDGIQEVKVRFDSLRLKGEGFGVVFKGDRLKKNG